MLGRWTAALCLLCALHAHEASAQPLSSACIESSSSLVPISRDEAQDDIALPSPVRDDELPWCASDEDPRCAPLQGSSAPSSVSVRIASAIEPFATKAEAIASAVHDFMPHAGLLPSAGTESRLERPPRAARRAL